MHISEQARYAFNLLREAQDVMVPTGIDSERMKRYYKRIVAVDRALKCLIAKYPAAVFYAFVCPTGSLQHFDALTRHDSA